MNFTADFIATQARNAGLNVYVAPGQDSDFTTLRISAEGLHLVVTTRWTGHDEEVYTARLIEPRWEGYDVYIPQGFDQVDRFSGAHSFALLGWVITHIQHLADEKARWDRREAEIVAKERAAKVQRRANQRAVRAYRRARQNTQALAS